MGIGDYPITPPHPIATFIHGIAMWCLMLTLYSAKPPMINMHINSLAGGSLMDKEPFKAQCFIEMLANNDYGWNKRVKSAGKKQRVYKPESFNAFLAQISLLSKKLYAYVMQGKGTTSGVFHEGQVSNSSGVTLADYASGNANESDGEAYEQANLRTTRTNMVAMETSTIKGGNHINLKVQ